MFASFDFEFCFLLMGDPNVDFYLFIPEGCGFPTLPSFLIFLDSDHFEFGTFFSPNKSACVPVLIMLLGSAASVGLGDISSLFEQFVPHLGNAASVGLGDISSLFDQFVPHLGNASMALSGYNQSKIIISKSF